MKYLAILTPHSDKTEQDFQAFRVAEEERVWQLYCAGVIRQMHFQPEPLRVVLEFEADSLADVHEHLATLPMVSADLFDMDVMYLGPWLPLAALFSEARPDEQR